MKVAFIGHRQVFAKNICEKLTEVIKSQIQNRNCNSFIMGTHGEFDSLALFACRRLRNIYKEIKIEVVITSLNVLKKDSEYGAVPYDDVETVMYDIEDYHYKQQITLSNRQMIDACDILICYVDVSKHRSGAKTALRYAERKGVEIINLYRREDQPFYGMSDDEVKAYWKNLSDKILGKKN